jgi:hypothetical protein
MRKALFFLTVVSLAVSCNQKEKDDFSTILKEFEAEPVNSRLVDFSYAGVHRNEVKTRLVPEHYQRFNVLDFGAIPDDGKDDIDAIQRAVDAAAAAGGGVVFIPKGTFDFDVQTKKRFVQISHSNISIIGAGEGSGGTVLHDHTPSDYPDPAKMWLGGLWPSFFLVSKLEADSVWSPYHDSANKAAELGHAGKNEMFIPLKAEYGLKAGKTYLLTMESEDNTLTEKLIYPLEKAGKNWWNSEGESKYKVKQLVTVVKNEGGILTLDTPLLWDIDEKYQPKLWHVPVMIENVAIGGIKMTTDWKDEFIHHLNSVHDGGWTHIRMSYCENSWVQNTIHEHTTGAVSLSNSKNCAVWHARIKGNIGHNGFNVSGFSTRNLLYNLHGGQAYHTFALSGYSSGNVYYNCYSEEPSSIDLHGGIGVHNLFDNIIGPQFRHGGSASALPPATGHGLVMWNYHVGITEPYKGIIKNSIAKFTEIPGFTLVGIQSAKGQEIFMLDQNDNRVQGDYSGDWGAMEYWNKTPNPRSLFRYQLEQRLGKEMHHIIDIK